MVDKSGLPKSEELKKLPFLAIVAFVARSACRVQPLFNIHWKQAPKEQVEAVNRVISLLQNIANGDLSNKTKVEVTTAATLVAATINATTDTLVTAVACTIGSAVSAFEDASPVLAAYTAYTATYSIAAYYAYTIYYDDAITAAKKAMYADFKLLRETANKERWTDKTTIPLDFFGPLWPDGEPEQWPTT